MKKLILLIVILVSCKSISDNKSIFQKNIIDSDIYILEKSNVFGKTYNHQKLFKIKYKKIEYFVNVNSENEIVYALTWDKDFISPDSIKIGDTFSKIKRISTFKSAYSDNFVYELKSGWNAVLKYEYYENQSFPDDSSRVVWLEKYER